MQNRSFIGAMLGLFGLIMTIGESKGQDQIELKVEKLNSTVNTDAYDESSPVVTLDGRYLFFTRTGAPDFDKTIVNSGRDVSLELPESEYLVLLSDIYTQIAGVEISDPVSSLFNQDIWMARLHEGEIGEVVHPDWPLNNALPNSVVSASADTHSIVMLNQFYNDGSMYEGFSIVQHANGEFGQPYPMHIYDFYNMSEEANLALSNLGQIAILSLKRKDSKGQNDLYLSFKMGDRVWSEPQHIGGGINTEFQETNPFITSNGRHMYFSSDRPGSIGGVDIWVTSRLDYSWTKWSEPERLQRPINSEFDDSQGCIDASGDYFYFTSRRDGNSDIFRASVISTERLESPLLVEFEVRNGDTGEPVRAEIYTKPTSSRDYLEYFHTYTGFFHTEFSDYELYEIFVRKGGFQPAKIFFNPIEAAKQEIDTHHIVVEVFPLHVPARNMEESSTLAASPPETLHITKHNISEMSNATASAKVTVQPEEGKIRHELEQPSPITKGPEVEEYSVVDEIGVLKSGQRLSFFNIYFQRSTAIVLQKSYPALDNLVQGLRQNPSVIIRVEGHTDDVGNSRDLMELSWQRSAAVKTYLVDKGVDSERVKTIGFGSEKPIANNTDEASRMRNRRVEVRILSRD